MGLCRAFVPRDLAVARRVVLVLTAVATLVTVLFAAIVPSKAVGTWSEFAVAAPLTILVAAVAIAVIPRPPAWMWAAFPISATVSIPVVGLATHDASVTAQVFFLFPVLYAGAQLRRPAAYGLTALAALGEIVVTFPVLDARTAITDSSYVIGALGAATWLLVYAGEKVDALVELLRRQAAVDPLTGLVTRRTLDSAAGSAVAGAARNGGTSLLLIDIDHFKGINDKHGHLAGDRVLQLVSDAMTSTVRRTDVVCRMGGDEFAVLMPDCPVTVATRCANDLVRRVRDLCIDVSDLSMADGEAQRDPVRPTVSVGFAHLPTHADNVEDLYRAADASLYRAKGAGRDQAADVRLDAA